MSPKRYPARDGEKMKIRSVMNTMLMLLILLPGLSACNFPGLGSITETPISNMGIGETAAPDIPSQSTEIPPTISPEQPSSGNMEETPLMTAEGSVDCLVTPVEGSEVSTVFGAGDTAPILGKTPNGEWLAVKEANKPKPCWIPLAAAQLNVDLDVLEVLSPPVASTPSLGSISGVMWHEKCEFTGGQAGEPLVLGQGCVQWGAEQYQFGPNQVFDPFEEGWEGVTLHLGSGPCPSTGIGTTVTNVAGEYLFSGLNAGTYCISYNALTDGNDSILIPGEPTYPERGEDGFYQSVTLSEGENLSDVNFGYAWQFYN
jgi:hypothetical protein